MARLLNIEIVDAYFKQLMELNTDLKDYCGISVDDLNGKIASSDGLQSPALIFYGYTGNLSGNYQQTFNSREIAFAIVSYVDNDDFVGQLRAKSEAEEIGLEVLSRIWYDSKLTDAKWLYNNLKKESISYEKTEIGEDKLYGMEFHFTLNTPEPLVVSPIKWTDGGTICAE